MFNNDGFSYTHSFKTEYDDYKTNNKCRYFLSLLNKHNFTIYWIGDGTNISNKENFEKKRKELAEKKKAEIFEPVPGKRHKTCGLCQTLFGNYSEV